MNYEIKVRLTGISPLMLDRFGENGGTSPRAQAEKKLYINPETEQPTIPASMLLACFASAGLLVKDKHGKLITTKNPLGQTKQSLIHSAVMVAPYMCDIIHSKPWDVDVRAARNQHKGMIQSVRPIFYDWALEFTLEADGLYLPLEEGILRKVVDTAGTHCGIGSFRPQNAGPFGRFRVDKWELVSATEGRVDNLPPNAYAA